VYNVFALLPVYAAGIAGSDALAGANAWRSNSFSPWVTMTIVLIIAAVCHPVLWFMETMMMGRRSMAVLSRPLRRGRHVWAIASGDRVRVYAIERERAFVPHLWPLSLGIRGCVAGGREFSADDEAEAAFAYAAELDLAGRLHPAAAALARVINEHSAASA
jgi:hypothetical protein